MRVLMSPKPCTRRLAGWLHSRRCYHNSANSQKYDPKVSAIPFAISPEEAIYQSSIRACYHVDNHDGLVDAVLSRIFSANKPPRPLKIEPVYFPTWLVDAEVTAKVSEHNANSTVQTQATAQSLAIYLPGFDHFPLSLPRFRFNATTTSLCSTMDKDFDSLPDSDQRIICLPYTLSPFTLPEAARSLSLEQAKIDSTLRIEPESIRFPLMAPAYPVLFPVYLMQWEGFDRSLERKPHIFNMIVEAHKSQGIMYVESSLQSSYNIPQVDTGLWRFWSPQVLLLALNKGWEGGAAVHTVGDMCMTIYNGVIQPRFKRLITHLDKIASIPHIDKRVDKWLDRQLLSRELRLASSTLLPKEVINWDDVRIRRWDLKEVAENMDYWIKRMQATATRSMMKELTGSKNSMVVTVSSSGMQAGKGEEMQRHVQAELARRERLVEESKPQWLKIAEQEGNTTRV